MTYIHQRRHHLSTSPLLLLLITPAQQFMKLLHNERTRFCPFLLTDCPLHLNKDKDPQCDIVHKSLLHKVLTFLLGSCNSSCPTETLDYPRHKGTTTLDLQRFAYVTENSLESGVESFMYGLVKKLAASDNFINQILHYQPIEIQIFNNNFLPTNNIVYPYVDKREIKLAVCQHYPAVSVLLFTYTLPLRAGKVYNVVFQSIAYLLKSILKKYV